MQQPEKAFASYLEIPTRIPQGVWWTLRVLTLLATFGVMLLIATRPRAGLDLFWKLIIPSMPLMFAVIPGFWRQVCPMALLNQMPRFLGLSRELTLPIAAKNSIYIISTLIFFFVVTLRHVYFNTNPLSLLLLLGIALACAFAGGVIFKGRSGWCGTLCPLLPIQKAYGQAPLILVKNGYCATCLGCQKNCYDFNPRAAMHSDIADSDHWYSGHREFFVAGLPGLAIGFFTSTDPNQGGLLPYFIYMAQWIGMTLGLYMAFTRIVRISRYKAALVYAMGALVLFYWFAAPIMTGAVTEFTGLALPAWSSYIIFAGAAFVGGGVIFKGLGAERLFEQLNAPAAPKVGVQLGALRAAGAAAGDDNLVVDRGSGRSFVADAGRSLLEGIESAGIKIDYGCRLGMCGADPIVVAEGNDKLSVPSATETETLRRLGLEGRARMACVCRATTGGVMIDTKLDPRTLPEPEPVSPAIDLGEAASVRRVVIIGNGAAGTTAADEIRRLSPSCTIDLVAREKDNFYNRMAIARLLHGRTAMAGMSLQSPDWAEKKNVNVWLNTTATSIDRVAHEVLLGTGEKLAYDRLILAQGSRAVMPPMAGSDLPGCFVLRDAEGAMAIRAWRQEKGCRHAVVVGGGVLGIEAADALRQLNLNVTILQRSSRLMDRQLDARGSAILQRYLEGLGVSVMTEVRVERCVGEGRLTGIALVGGETIPADILVACAGISPNLEIAREAGLAVGRGVKVDAMMQTSDPDIFAVGDVAELPGSVSGLWAVSTAQGRTAAAAVFGREVPYTEPNTLVSLKMDGIDVKSYGAIEPSGPDQEAIFDTETDENEHRLLIVDNGALAGVMFVGPPGTGRLATDLIERRPDLTTILTDLRQGRWEALEKVL